MKKRLATAIILMFIVYLYACGNYISAGITDNTVYLYGLIDFLIISLIMMSVPLTLKLLNKITVENGKKICKWNSIIIFIISVITMATIEISFIGGLGAVTYYFINVNLFVRETNKVINEKEFNELCSEIWSECTQITKDLNLVLNSFGCKKHIEKNTNLFVETTFYFCMYFYNLLLIKKEFNDDYIFLVNVALVDEISKTLNINYDKSFQYFLKIRSELDELPNQPMFENYDIFTVVGQTYLVLALNNEYSTDKLNDNDFETLLLYLRNSFAKIIKHEI